MRPVPVQYFTKKIHDAESYHDILRIFYGDILTDEIIDSIMSSQPQSKMYGPPMGRPRIGGLSDTMSFALESPGLEGIIPSPFMHDSPLGGVEPLCENCEKFSRDLFSSSRRGSYDDSKSRNRRRDNKRNKKGNKKNRKGRRKRRKGRGKKYRQGRWDECTYYIRSHIVNPYLCILHTNIIMHVIYHIPLHNFIYSS